VPHSDVHFYGIATEEQSAVDCTDRTMPPTSFEAVYGAENDAYRLTRSEVVALE